MPTYQAPDAECLVFTFKDGLLARLAHDLKLRVETLSITIEPAESAGTAVRAVFDARSLRPLCFRHGDQDAPKPPSTADAQQITRHVAEVLATDQNPQITFASDRIEPDGDGFRIHGRLTLHGRSAPVTAQITRRDDRYVARAAIRQTDFGIAPFRAALGALRIQDRVTIELSVPAGTTPSLGRPFDEKDEKNEK